MRIAVLGWGSLTYDWHALSLREPVAWHEAGPTLPIEFSRISKGPRLTAVVDERNGEWVRTRYAESALDSVDQVVEELRAREGHTRRHWIGFVDVPAGRAWSRSSPAIVSHLRTWLGDAGIDSVVWTDIPPDFGDVPFSVGTAITHFLGLSDSEPVAMRDYIAWAPPEVDTPLRRSLKRRGLLDGAGAPCCQWPPA